MNDYSTRLNATKGGYPFSDWAQSGMEQYTREVCASFDSVFNRLIQRLADLGEGAPEEKKVDEFHTAVQELNALNEQDESLIETSEREELCELCDLVAVAAGIDPSRYGDGEGIATEWREW